MQVVEYMRCTSRCKETQMFKKKLAQDEGKKRYQRSEFRERTTCLNSPLFGDGARMALTPNLRKVGSLLLGSDVLGEHESCVIAFAPLKDTVFVAVGSEALVVGTVRFMKAAGRLIRSRSSTRKLECVGKTDGSVCWSGKAAAGR